MQKLQEIKKRIDSVQNIKTISQTLATVSAAKLSKTRERAAGMREYAQKMHQILCEQQYYLQTKGVNLEDFSPLLRERKAENTLLYMIASDKGMCGNYNLSVFWKSMKFWEAKQKAGQNVIFMAKGKKSARYIEKRGLKIAHLESWRREGVLPEEVERILSYLALLFLSKQVDEVYAVYTQFHSPIKRVTLLKKLLPIKLKPVKKARPLGQSDKWFYEPAFAPLFNELLFIYLRVRLYDFLLESFASEQGARMINMQEAVERAEKKLKECYTDYNRLRREIITLDLLGVLFSPKAMEEEVTAPTFVT